MEDVRRSGSIKGQNTIKYSKFANSLPILRAHQVMSIAGSSCSSTQVTKSRGSRNPDRGRMAFKEKLVTWLKLDKTEAKVVHLFKLFSCCLRLCIVGAVLVTGMLVLYTAGSMNVLRRSRSGWMSDETCFFFTGEEYGVNSEIAKIEASIGSETFCGLTAEQVRSAFASALSNSESTSFDDHFTVEYIAQFFVAVGYAMFFVGVAVMRVINSVWQKDKGLDKRTSGIKELWNLLLLTMLAGYLAFPLGSVKILPEPADKVVLVRTPPDYATAQIYTFFFLCPFLCCIPIWTFCKEEPGGTTAHCMLVTSLLVAIPILAIISHGYYSMKVFYLDFTFSLSLNFSFVVVGMIAKAFLWTVAVVDTLAFVVEAAQKCLYGKDKVFGQKGMQKDQRDKASDRQ